MLRSIMGQLFGESRPRTNSVPDNYRPEQSLRRQLSIDSKQKKNALIQRQADLKKKIVEDEMEQMDEMSTIKRRGDTINVNAPNLKDDVGNLDFVSDIAREDLQPLQSETIEVDRAELLSSIQASPKKSTKQLSVIGEVNTDSLQQLKGQHPTKSEMIQQLPKILVRRQPSVKVFKRIEEECFICKKPLKKTDYLQLACTHRFHRACAIKMQERNSYNCDQCNKTNRLKRGSILLNSRNSNPFRN